jgi:aspartate dehydrogenase
MTLKVAVAGLGTIGLPVAQALHRGIPGLSLAGVCVGREEVARQRLDMAGITVPIQSIAALAETADVVVECVPTRLFASIAEPTLAAGRLLVTVSGAALLESPGIVEVARRAGGRILLVTGALLGLDAVRAAAEGTIHSVRMITRKPPASLRGAPYLDAHGIDISRINAAIRVFKGSAREGARGFPANVNVAAALSLAGIGPDRTELEIWADPDVTRNTHTIEVDADTVRFSMTIENVPSIGNPGTGQITPLSVIATLRGLTASLHVGS